MSKFRRMLGTAISSKGLKTFKIIMASLVSIALVALLSREAFATSGLNQYEAEPFGSGDITHSETYVEGRIIPVSIIDEFDNIYDLTYTNQVYDLVIANQSSYITVVYEGTISAIEYILINGNSMQNDCFFNLRCSADESFDFSLYSGNMPVSGGITRVDVNMINATVNYPDANIVAWASTPSSAGINTHYNAIINSNQYNGSITLGQEYNVTAIVRYPVTNANIGNVLALLPFTHIYGSNPRTSNFSFDGYYNEYNDREIWSAMDNKLWYIWGTENNIYNELLSMQNANSFAGQLSSQMASEADQAHNDSVNTQDILQNDHGNTSSTINDINNDYLDAQDAEFTAVDSAVPSYSSELSYVENTDLTAFWSDQLVSAGFWRDLGEYVMDNRNIGFVAGGLVIVIIVGLFAFILRL